MKLWQTFMQVVNQETKELLLVGGPRVKSPTRESAQRLLDKHDFNYLMLGNEILAEVPCIPGTDEPDWDRMIDFQSITEN